LGVPRGLLSPGFILEISKIVQNSKHYLEFVPKVLLYNLNGSFMVDKTRDYWMVKMGV
jgi:hypothetical protein